MKKLLGAALVLSAILLLVTVQATAGVIRLDTFTAQANPDGVVTGGGTGWDNGRFVAYESGWYNQWFYNDPPLPAPQWKWITYDIDVQPGPGEPADIAVAINWSTLAWPATGPAGPPPGGGVPLTVPEEDVYIVRSPVYSGPVLQGMILTSTELEQGGRITIPYNPEWVSIDIRVRNPGEFLNPVSVSGTIGHQCVPEPSTLVLLGLGAWAFVLWRKR